MRLIRIITVSFAFFIFAMGSLVLSFILFPIAKFRLKKEKQRQYYIDTIHKTWEWFTKILYLLGIMKVEFQNQDELKNLRGKIIVANHPSLIDIVLLIGFIPNSVSVVKEALARNFFVKNIVKNAYLINNLDVEKFQADAKELLDAGFNIVIFPTGTRSMDNEPVKLHSGAAQLALMTNKEIIPIRIDMNPPFLPKNVPVSKGAGSKRAIYKIKKQETINPADFDTQNQIKTRKAICSKIKEACFIHN